MNEQIILGVPGIWNNPTEVAKAVKQNSKDLLFAGFTLMDVASQDISFLEFHEYDPRLADVFETIGTPSINEAELEKIATHKSTLWVMSSDVSIDHARRMMRIGNQLLQAGGLGVKVETSAIAHSASRWNELTNTSLAMQDDVDSLYCAYVQLIEGDEVYHSCGMHNFGLPDVAVAKSIGLANATKLLNEFNEYQLAELPTFKEGDLFSLTETDQPFQLSFADCTAFPIDHPAYNSFGRWQLTAR